MDVVLANEPLHDGHGEMRQGAGRERLDGNARRNEGPGISEVKRASIEAAARGVEEAVIGLEDMIPGSPAEQGEVGRDNARLGGMAGVKGLGHDLARQIGVTRPDDKLDRAPRDPAGVGGPRAGPWPLSASAVVAPTAAIWASLLRVTPLGADFMPEGHTGAAFDYVTDLSMMEAILEKTLFTVPLNWGIAATAATATIPAARAYSTRSWPCVSFQKFHM